MKLILVLVTSLFALSATAYQDGSYNCGSKDIFLEYNYKISTVALNGVSVPHLEITKKYYKNPENPKSEDRTYNIQGFATIYKTDADTETLAIGNITIDMKDGQPDCVKSLLQKN